MTNTKFVVLYTLSALARQIARDARALWRWIS